MAAQPILVRSIPSQVLNEGSAIIPLDLNEFIKSPDEDSGSIVFMAELNNGASLPNGLICTQTGMLGGIPAKDTQGEYDVLVIAQNQAPEPLVTELKLIIKDRIHIETSDTTKIKAQVWEALSQNLPMPDIGDLFDRPVSAEEVQYLLERFATFSIWDVYNLDPAGEKQLLNLPGVSEHFNIYDRGSCLIGTPKELFSHARTLEDALRTARAMAREVFNRGWVVEFSGFHKMARAAWVELQVLAEHNKREVEVLHYIPTEEDTRLFTARLQSMPGLKSERGP